MGIGLPGIASLGQIVEEQIRNVVTLIGGVKIPGGSDQAEVCLAEIHVGEIHPNAQVRGGGELIGVAVGIGGKEVQALVVAAVAPHVQCHRAVVAVVGQPVAAVGIPCGGVPCTHKDVTVALAAIGKVSGGGFEGRQRIKIGESTKEVYVIFGNVIHLFFRRGGEGRGDGLSLRTEHVHGSNRQGVFRPGSQAGKGKGQGLGHGLEIELGEVVVLLLCGPCGASDVVAVYAEVILCLGEGDLHRGRGGLPYGDGRVGIEGRLLVRRLARRIGILPGGFILQVVDLVDQLLASVGGLEEIIGDQVVGQHADAVVL